MESPYLAILVLNYGGCEDTIACAESILKASRSDFELVLIDNGSPDGSVEKLRAWAERRLPRSNTWRRPGKQPYVLEEIRQKDSPRVALLQTGSNLGFAGGNNIGIRYALAQGASWILLLNNDTIVETDTLAKLMEGAERSGADLAGCGVYEYDRPSAPWYLGGTFNWWCDRAITSLRAPLAAELPVETDWITGCCLLVRRQVFEKIGLLDEGAFLYHEDSDFCRQAAKAGFRRFVVLGAKVYHKVSRSAITDSPLQRYHGTRSRLYFHSKNYAPASHTLFLIAFVLSRMLRSAVWLVQGRWDLINASWRGLVDSFRHPREPNLRPRE